MKQKIPLFLLTILLLFTFRSFLQFSGFVGGDWPYFYREQLAEMPFIAPAWNAGVNLGSVTVSPWIDTYVSVIVALFVNTLGVPWGVIQAHFFYLLAIVLSAGSATVLYRMIFRSLTVLPAIIYTLNTYFLLIIGGGQLGIVLGYAVAPLVFAAFLNVIRKKNLTSSFLAGLAISLQMLFEMRIAYVTLVAVGLYLVYSLVFLKRFQPREFFRSFVFVCIIPAILLLLLHAFWLLPNVIFRVNPKEVIGSARNTLDAVRFFSFAEFEQTFSLLHPYWPENIFGKVSFMRQEFLFVPILAFSSLLFFRTKARNHAEPYAEQRRTLFFVLLGLGGAFLAKGANDPFGAAYLWLFQYVPGFFMFRDATKFYVLIALSYSMLIPFSLFSVSEWITSKIKDRKIPLPSGALRYIFPAVSVVVGVYFLALAYPTVSGGLGGTFTRSLVPQEYVYLKDYIREQDGFFRTFWIPQRQRFGYYSSLHPAINGQDFFQTSSGESLVRKLRQPASAAALREASVRYIIVPYDSLGELFLEDRKYDASQYDATVEGLEKIPWLTRVDDANMGNIAVFVLDGARDRFWSDNGGVTWRRIGVSEYEIEPQNGTIRKLVFSEQYSPHWVARGGGREVEAEQYNEHYNSFPVQTAEKFIVYYKPEQYVSIGGAISALTLVFVLGVLIIRRKYA